MVNPAAPYRVKWSARRPAGPSRPGSAVLDQASRRRPAPSERGELRPEAQQPGCLLHRAVRAVRDVVPGVSASRSVTVSRHRSHGNTRFASRPNQRATPSAYPRSVSAPSATAWKLSPSAVDRFAIAARNTPATSAACTCCTVSSPRFGNASSSPRASVSNTARSRCPAGFTGGQPGPLMWPGCTRVTGSPCRRARSSR